VLSYLLFFNGFALIVWGVAHLVRKLRKKK
jgi:hypothetical protein